MATEVEKYRIPLFDGTQFNNWKFRMETLLEELDLLSFVEAPYVDKVVFEEGLTAQERTRREEELAALKIQDRKCKSQLIQRIADSQLEYAKDKVTSFDLWTSLCNTFERKGIASQLLLRKKLLTMKFNANNDSLVDHFLKFDKLIRDLRSTGATVEESDIVCHLLLTMPSEYEVVVTAIETLSMKDLTLSFVKNRLLDEESKRKDVAGKKSNTQPPTAFQIQHQSGKGKNSTETDRKGNSGTSFNFTCHRCGKFGHKRVNCKVKLPKNSGKNNSANVTDVNEESGFCFGATCEDHSNENINWFLDSGATEHLINSKTPLRNVEKLECPVKIKVAKSGTYLEAKLKGEIKVISVVKGKEIEVTIRDVLSVPGLSYNLLSVRKLEMNGLSIIFENCQGLIKKGNETIAVANRNESQLYALNFLRRKALSVGLSENNIQLWHNRLGHLSYESVKTLSLQVDGMKLDASTILSERCSNCIEGKQSQLPYNQSRRRANRPLELIHSDLCGPITPESFDGKKYVLTFIDDYTHFTVAYALESKSEVTRYMKMYHAMATAHFNLKISRFRCDNGREYMSSELKDFFEQQGIQFEFTIRYTPQQNGVSERMNRTLIEKARCMILQCKLNKTFWSEAVRTAVYLVNRSPTSALKKKIPAALWYNEKPDVSKLRIFGCIAYLLIPKELRTGKFDSKSLKCYFTGYCPNGYRLWCPEERKIITGKNVIFYEGRFDFESSPSEEWIPEHNKEQEVNVEEEVTDEEYNSTEEMNERIHVPELTSDEEELDEQNKKDEKETLRRSTRKKVTPKYLQDYAILALNAESFVDNVPESYKEVATHEDKEHWDEAIMRELKSIEENKTWTYTQLPHGRKAIASKWVFKLKRKKDGSVEEYKARLVIKGCSQKKGYDYEETYAPVARAATVKVVLAVANEYELILQQLDVANAFLHGKLKEEIYMLIPEGVKNKPGLVCKLHKSLYGLKQAPLTWNESIHNFLMGLGFTQSEADRCLYIFILAGIIVYLVLYVDDILIAGNNKLKIEELKSELKKKFKIKDMGEPQSFLGIEITRKKGEMYLSQTSYLRSLLTRFKMEDCNPVKTPMEVKLEIKSGKRTDKPCRELIGCLMYAMTATRPDLSAAVNYLSRYQTNPTEELWVSLKRVLRYIKGTLDLKLYYRKGNQDVLLAYADSNWNKSEDSRSTSGYLLQVFGNTVCWATKKQTSVALSSTEAEYVALATAAAELLWLKYLIDDLQIPLKLPIRMFEDNQSCIRLLQRWEHRRSRHVNVKYNFVRQLYNRRIIIAEHVSSEDQVADIFTKGLPAPHFIQLRTALGLI